MSFAGDSTEEVAAANHQRYLRALLQYFGYFFRNLPGSINVNAKTTARS
jgi:hypothetical protein